MTTFVLVYDTQPPARGIPPEGYRIAEDGEIFSSFLQRWVSARSSGKQPLDPSGWAYNFELRSSGRGTFVGIEDLVELERYLKRQGESERTSRFIEAAYRELDFKRVVFLY